MQMYVSDLLLNLDVNNRTVTPYGCVTHRHISNSVKEVPNILITFTSGSGVPRGGLGCLNPPPPEIPKISVESSIAWARRTGASISFCSSLCSHTIVIYYIKVSFNANCLAVAYLISEFECTPASWKFDKVKLDCKLGGKCCVPIPTS